MVFCSDKDRAVAGQELHTNFTLSGDGEELILVRPDGVTVVATLNDSPTLMAMDKAYVTSGGSFKETLVALVISDSFLYRK